MDVRVVDHPLAAARLSTLRDERTDNAAFRAALRDLTLMLVYEATRDAPSEQIAVRTPLAATVGSRLATPPLLVPVLRAGLGMVDQAHALIPEAQVGFVGVARDESTHQPHPYLESLPADLATQRVMVLGPRLQRWEDALADFLRSHELQPEPQVLMLVAGSEEKLGRPDRALAFYRRSLQRDPSLDVARRNVERLEQELGVSSTSSSGSVGGRAG